MSLPRSLDHDVAGKRMTDFVSAFEEASRGFHWSEACFVHLHIPRTAGTSFRQAVTRHLLQRYPPEQMYLLECGPEYNCRNGTFAEFAALSPDERSQIRFVAGHVPPSIVPLLPHPITFTILRDPVERAISHYWYTYFDRTSGLHEVARRVSLTEFISSGLGHSSNGQARYLSEAFFTGEQMSDERLLESARAALARVTYSCALEQADDLLSGICTVAGVDRAEKLPRLNEAPRLREPTPDELAIIAEHNRVDSELYATVLQSRRPVS